MTRSPIELSWTAKKELRKSLSILTCIYLYLYTCGSVLHLFILCFRFLSMVACVIVSMIVSMVACEKQSWNNLRCITFPCGERRINNSNNNVICMYNSNRPRSPFYIGTGHLRRHNHLINHQNGFIFTMWPSNILWDIEDRFFGFLQVFNVHDHGRAKV